MCSSDLPLFQTETAQHEKRKEENIMPNITGHTELVGLMAYPIRHTQSPTTHNLAYDKNGDDVIQLAFEVDNDSLKDAVQSIRALKMLGSNISMPNKTVVHKYLDEVDEAAKLCGAINTVVNLRDENGQVTGKLKGDRKSTRLNSSHSGQSRMPSSA